MTTMCPSPLRWYGSKARLMRQLVPLIPDHAMYVSVFGGSGADIAHKPPSRAEVYNDLNGNLAAFFRVLGNDALRRRLIARLHWLIPSRVLYEDLRTICREGHEDPVQVALATYYCSIWSHGGRDPAGTKRSPFALGSRRPVPHRWIEVRRHLNAVARRFQGVLIENRPWQDVVGKFDGPRSFLYCDPPYEHSTRHDVDYYRHEMSHADHEALLAGLQAVRGLVMLSGYECDLYKRHLGSWRRHTFEVTSSASSVHAARVETVWMNYDEAGNRLQTKKGAA